MSEFKKYMHVERFGNTEVSGIENGECWIFPKIDGTNASVWMNNGAVQCGSRRRHLSTSEDNAGFCEWAKKENSIIEFLNCNTDLRLFGEWLVPHTLKTYTEKSWRNFYVFDVFNDATGAFIPYEEYKLMLDEFEINYIPALALVNNPNPEQLTKFLDKNTFLVKDGEGTGEGIVIKNYDFVNRYGRTVWAKIVKNEFKTQHGKNNKIKPTLLTEEIEMEIVDKFLTPALVEKTYAKISIDGWESKMIPKLLNVVFYDMVNEEIWNICKKFKMPKIDFRRLNTLAIQKIKEIKPEIF